MATTNTGISKFKSNFSGGARPNLFECRIDFPDNNQLLRNEARFLIKGGSIPASVIAPIEIPFRGQKLKVAGDRTFEPWTVTVINDVNFNLRDAFESWMNRVNNHEANVSDDAVVGRRTRRVGRKADGRRARGRRRRRAHIASHAEGVVAAEGGI